MNAYFCCRIILVSAMNFHKKIFSLGFLLCAFVITVSAQRKANIDQIFLDTIKISPFDDIKIFRGSETILWDIDHVSLDVTPIFEEKRLKGSALLRMSPYRRPMDHINIDAKGFDIHQVDVYYNNDTLSVSYVYS